jgi:hypothetical protein
MALQCCNAQGQLRYYWRVGTQNLANYFTKHHPASHHKANRPTFLTLRKDPQYTKLFLMPQDKKPYVKIPTKLLTTKKSFAKSFLQESTPNTKVQDHDHQHSHSKKCLKIPTTRVCQTYVSMYLSDGTNCQISSNYRQSYNAP